MRRAFKYSLLVAIGFAAFICVAFAVGNVPFTRSDHITIKTSPDKIVEHLIEPKKARMWMTDLQDVSELTNDAQGSVTRNIYLPHDMFKQSVEVDGTQRVTFQYDDHFATITDEYSFTPGKLPDDESDKTDGDVTEVKRTVRYEYKGWHRVIAPFIRNAVSRRVGEELGELQSVIETDESNEQVSDQASKEADE